MRSGAFRVQAVGVSPAGLPLACSWRGVFVVVLRPRRLWVVLHLLVDELVGKLCGGAVCDSRVVSAGIQCSGLLFVWVRSWVELLLLVDVLTGVRCESAGCVICGASAGVSWCSVSAVVVCRRRPRVVWLLLVDASVSVVWGRWICYPRAVGWRPVGGGACRVLAKYVRLRRVVVGGTASSRGWGQGRAACQCRVCLLQVS